MAKEKQEQEPELPPLPLAEILKHGAVRTAPKLVIYGHEGIGKTTLASKAPSPLFLLTENGTRSIPNVTATPLLTSYSSVIRTMKSIRNDAKNAGIQTLVVDTADALEVLIHRSLCEKFSVDYLEKADGGYGKGYAYAEREWRRFLLEYVEPITAQGIMVVFCAHSQDKSISDLELNSYTTYCLKLQDKARHVLLEWADAVLFLTREIGAAKGEDGGNNPRILRCSPQLKCESKNRFGFPETIPAESLWSKLQTNNPKEN